ncbi:nSTAND1 domain-containing NTPase [Nostoc sp.]|uniref:nSTAND1 domain-containing NTPase n=1 Tax=Nostoc sp. TaxID=1180 RepID=UPI002FF50F59
MARYALVIGIAEYLSPSLARLSKTTNDAEAIAQLLEQYGDFQSVQRLPQRWNKDKNGYEMAAQKVTGAQLGQDLRTFLLEQAANNEALIYFSGHGFTISDNLGQQKGYLASSDCQIEFKENENVEQKYGIPLDSLNDLIRDSQLSSLVMLLDCCHSGYFLERQLIERTLNAFSSQKDYYLITACRGFERAGVIKSEEYSIFTGAVVKGLTAENAGNSRRISGDRLFDFVSNELKGSVQEPIRMGWGRSITLVTYPQLDIPTVVKIAFNQENPYRGLYAFESEQAQYFCGRDEAVRTLISRLAESRFLAVIGYSGSGKSSLVKAGLLPQLKGDRLPGSSEWEIASFTPGEHPLGKLVDILTRQQQQNRPHLLFIDQFEEIFTLCQDDEERKAFIRLVAQEVKKGEGETRIILTIRGDFLNRCADYREIITLINNIPPTSFIVTPMSFAELEEAIEKPAKLHGVNFERGLVSQISADVVNRPGALPILQYALKELWRVCIEEPESPEPLLTHKGYEEIGGVKGALDKRATILYESLTTVDQAFARCLFMELVQLGEAGEVTRRRASWERLEVVADSPQQLQRVIGLLAGSQQRLIITDKNTVEVAHEALLSEWKLLNTWITENLENIRLSRSLEEDCQEWVQRFNKSDDALLAGANLAVISEWVNKTQPRLTPQEIEFLHKSLEKRDRQIQAQLEQERQLRELAESRQKEAEARAIAEIEKAMASEDKAKAEAARAKEAEASAKYQKQRTRLAIAVGVLAIFSLILAQRWQLEVKQQEVNTALGVIRTSKDLIDGNKQLEVLIESLKALEQITNPKYLNEIQQIILQIRERNRLEGHGDLVTSVNSSPDGRKLTSASYDGIVKLWDINGGLITNMAMHTNRVYSVKFSPDNQLIASASADHTIIIWTKDGKYVRTLNRHKDAVYDIAFSPDSQYLVSASRDKSIILWNVKNGNFLKSYVNESLIRRIDFAPDGKNIAFTSDNNIKIWNRETEKSIIFGKHNPPGLLSSVKFSPKANILVSSDYSGEIYIWSIKNLENSDKRQPIKTFKTRHIGYLNNINLSNDGKIIASAGEDGIIKLWDKDGNLLKFIKAHRSGVQEVSFIPDNNNFIASSSADTTVRLWFIGEYYIPQKFDEQKKNLVLSICNSLYMYINNKLILKQDTQNFLNIQKTCKAYM